MMHKLRAGTVVTVTTQYRNPLLNARSAYRQYTYRNVKVLPSDPWLSDREFKIESDAPNMPYRTINMANVIRLEIDNKAEHIDPLDRNAVQTRTVEGSKGNQYTVSFQGKTVLSCTCPQNSIRRMKCKHMMALEQGLI